MGADSKTSSSFALLECYDYAYYATLDVRFYASLPLLKFWPAIDKQVLREFAATVPKEWPEKGLWVWKTQLTGKPVLHMRKKIGAVPHDLGVPAGDPFISVNEPGWQDTNDWKDLNSKFVLMVYRDYVLTGSKDKALLRETWPAVKDAIQYLRQFDSGGGIPENSGYPDQTYDDWVVKGVSAYSGGLWLAALRAAEETARTLSDTQAEKEYHELFLKGQKTYIGKLWNGEYFRYDTEPANQDAIQTDQLAGQWYANMLGLGDLVPHTMQVSALKTIFDHNVMRFGGGTMGAVNGMTTNGTVIDNPEGKEVWVGTTEAYAALLKSEGMNAEAYKALWGLYNVIYVSKGYWFRTPEAWDIDGNFRASMYMRPSAIWAVEMVKPTHELAGQVNGYGFWPERSVRCSLRDIDDSYGWLPKVCCVNLLRSWVDRKCIRTLSGAVCADDLVGFAVDGSDAIAVDVCHIYAVMKCVDCDGLRMVAHGQRGHHVVCCQVDCADGCGAVVDCVKHLRARINRNRAWNGADRQGVNGTRLHFQLNDVVCSCWPR